MRTDISKGQDQLKIHAGAATSKPSLELFTMTNHIKAYNVGCMLHVGLFLFIQG